MNAIAPLLAVLVLLSAFCWREGIVPTALIVFSTIAIMTIVSVFKKLTGGAA